MSKTLKIVLILTIIIIMAGLVYFFVWPKQHLNNNQQSRQFYNLGWQLYKSDELGFNIEYPQEWKISNLINGIVIIPPGERPSLPEGGGVLSVTMRNITLDDFIKEYNSAGIIDNISVSKIIKQEETLINNIKAYKLTASTAIGINENLIFIIRLNRSLIIKYQELDQQHEDIISSFKLIN